VPLKCYFVCHVAKLNAVMLSAASPIVNMLKVVIHNVVTLSVISPSVNSLKVIIHIYV
jgi:hypothetical protein